MSDDALQLLVAYVQGRIYERKLRAEIARRRVANEGVPIAMRHAFWELRHGNKVALRRIERTVERLIVPEPSDEPKRLLELMAEDVAGQEEPN